MLSRAGVAAGALGRVGRVGERRSCRARGTHRVGGRTAVDAPVIAWVADRAVGGSRRPAEAVAVGGARDLGGGVRAIKPSRTRGRCCRTSHTILTRGARHDVGGGGVWTVASERADGAGDVGGGVAGGDDVLARGARSARGASRGVGC